jgi:hypothetical protein
MLGGNQKDGWGRFYDSYLYCQPEQLTTAFHSLLHAFKNSKEEMFPLSIHRGYCIFHTVSKYML